MVVNLVVSYLTFPFPFFFEQFLVLFVICYEQTMSGSHRSLLVRRIGSLLVFFSDMGSCLSWSIVLFFSKAAPCCLDVNQPKKNVIPI